jgi:hypothetical protein
MRTTITIEDGLLQAAKQRGLERGMTLGAVVEDALRTVLDPARTSMVEPAPLPVSKRRGGTRPGVDVADGARLRDVMDQT